MSKYGCKHYYSEEIFLYSLKINLPLLQQNVNNEFKNACCTFIPSELLTPNDGIFRREICLIKPTASEKFKAQIFSAINQVSQEYIGSHYVVSYTIGELCTATNFARNN